MEIVPPQVRIIHVGGEVHHASCGFFVRTLPDGFLPATMESAASVKFEHPTVLVIVPVSAATNTVVVLEPGNICALWDFAKVPPIVRIGCIAPGPWLTCS